jgi:hypothetical protein
MSIRALLEYVNASTQDVADRRLDHADRRRRHGLLGLST